MMSLEMEILDPPTQRQRPIFPPAPAIPLGLSAIPPLPLNSIALDRLRGQSSNYVDSVPHQDDRSDNSSFIQQFSEMRDSSRNFHHPLFALDPTTRPMDDVLLKSIRSASNLTVFVVSADNT